MSYRGRAPRILVIDDEEDVTQLLRLGLERYGFEVDAYNDPVEAVSEFLPGTYDLAVLDIRMPRMNGFLVYRAMKKADKEVEVCFLTAFEMYENEFKKLFPDVNVQRFLKKPITMEDLAREVNRLLAKKRGSPLDMPEAPTPTSKWKDASNADKKRGKAG